MGQHIINLETIKRYFKVNRYEINYISVIIGSYDGMAIVRTLDPYTAIIEVQISPQCNDIITEILDSMIKNEGIKLEEVQIKVK